MNDLGYWVGVLAVGVWPCVAAADVRFEAGGIVTRTFYMPASPALVETNRFKVTAADCHVTIRVDGGQDPVVDYIEHRSDGIESSHLIAYIPFSPDEQRRAMNDSNLSLYPYPVPFTHMNMIPAVWLAFASRCYYSDDGSGLVSPIFGFCSSLRNRGLEMPAEWRFASEAPHFLSHLVEPNDGKSYRDGDDGFTVVEKLPRALRNRGTNLLFVVSSWTNSSGMTFPRTFDLNLYEPNEQKTEFELRVTWHGEATSVSVEPALHPDELAISTATRILDYRLKWEGKALPPVSYYATNAQVMTVAEVEASSLHRDAIQHFLWMGIQQPRRPVVWIVVWSVAVIALAAAPIVLIRAKRARS